MIPRSTAVLARTELSSIADPWLDGDPVAHRLEEATFRGPVVEASAQRGLVTIPGVARYLLSIGDPVRVHADPEAGVEDVGCFLSGPVRALDLQLHGVYSLQAAAVRIEDRAVVICGGPAAGKSVLAAALAMRGHDVLADDVSPVVVRPEANELWTTANAVELWPPAMKRLAINDVPARTVRPALAKLACEIRSPCQVASVAVGSVVVLSIDHRLDAVEATPMRAGREKVAALAARQWHRELSPHTGAILAQFQWLAGLAASVPITRLSRPLVGWKASEMADIVESRAG